MSKEFEQLKAAVDAGERVVTLSGVTSTSAKAHIIARLRGETKKRFAIVADSNTDLDVWASDLSFWSESAIATIPSFEADPYSGVSPHAETQERRALSLWRIANGGGGLVVLSARSLIQRTPGVAEIQNLGCELVRDNDIAPEQLVGKLIAGGYVREDPIFGPGQFSLRGGIIDIWSPDAEQPVRIEFFGDTVDSIRVFDP
ncbi:MAG: hypothetical protein HOP17_11995, partial [Acidobacteria bacterium]|nr:hypothetical protein [Acidobacteriota bacterium]